MWPGIDIEHQHASQSCLIGNELAELAERPVVQPSSLATAGLKPTADVGHIRSSNPMARPERCAISKRACEITCFGLETSVVVQRACAAGLRLKRKVAGWDDDFLASLIAV